MSVLSVAADARFGHSELVHSFDARLQTFRLQEAVRTCDRTLLADLIDDRFLFSSTRVSTQIDKAAWIDWACGTEWVAFALGDVRDVGLLSAHLVSFTVDQEIGGRQPSTSRWLVTDLWTENDRGWQLISRHPELELVKSLAAETESLG